MNQQAKTPSFPAKAGNPERSTSPRKDTARRIPARAFAIGFLLFFSSCLQGPWDYYPEKPPVHKGLWVTGYLVADAPVTDFCIERLLRLDEEYTNAFNFYQSATVEITGEFGGTRTIALQPHPENRNCFVGLPGDLPSAGNSYDLQAVITWDSSGQTAITTITGTANIPSSFSIKDTAHVPALTQSGVNASLDTGSLTGFASLFNNLPMSAQDELSDAYGDTLGQLILANDPAALADFIISEQDNINAILDKYQVIMVNGDTVFYLTSIFNTQSHIFSANYSDDVGGVLITHRFDTTESKPETAFDSFFGFELDTADFYTPGDIRRLNLYPNFRLDEDRTFLDSIGVINTWYFTGLNRLYFYGFEDAYIDYVETAVYEENNSRIKRQYNVQGAAGVFAGAIKDSFDVNIVVDSQTTVYPLYDARALDCRDKGWEIHQGCRSFYPIYCRDINWNHSDCVLDFLQRGLEGLFPTDLDSLQDELGMSDTFLDQLRRAAETRYCIENNFPASPFDCSEIYSECHGPDRIYDCKQKLWNYCLDNKWNSNGNHPQCDLGLVSYCLDRPRTSELLCGNADTFCAANLQESLCIEASQN